MTRRLQIQQIPAVKMGADPRRVERALVDVKAAIDDILDSDTVIETPRRLMLRSPDGHYWALTVSNAGVLGAVDMGTAL
jgi:hypothetical protein